MFSVTRALPPGIRRYAQSWSGDNITTATNWQSLFWNICTGLQMSLSDRFNLGQGVGGSARLLPGAELLLRRIQAYCLSPRMLMNSWKVDGSSRAPTAQGHNGVVRWIRDR